MSRSLYLIHLGPGKVGKTFLKILARIKNNIEEEHNVKLKIGGIFDSKISSKKVNSHIKESPSPLVLIDTTASFETYPHVLQTLSRSDYVVLSNKKLLSSTLIEFYRLYRFKKKLFFETTVGAGLPIISTVRELLGTGDKILEIKGCFSGTLGLIFSGLQAGQPFSQVLLEAKNRGFTEPDPRDDLSGIDIARKVLILGRIIGMKLTFEQIKLQSLYPKEWAKLSVEKFLEKLTSLDQLYKRMFIKAKKKNNTFRYVAKVNQKDCSVGLEEVPINSDLGALTGSDNIVVIKTKRYNKNLMVIKGPGAGLEVTAAGVLGDLLKIVKIIGGSIS